MYPSGVAIAQGGDIYVADYYNNRVEWFGSLTTPVMLTSWGLLKSRYR